MSDRPARRFMNAAIAFPQLTETNSVNNGLAIEASALYALAAPKVPQAVRDAAVERADASERITMPASQVAGILDCSADRAEQLHAEAQADARRQRDADIAAKATEGKSVRQISEETGIARSTVQDRLSVRKTDDRITGQQLSPEPSAEPMDRERVASLAAEINSPADRRWFSVLDALRILAAAPIAPSSRIQRSDPRCWERKAA